MGCGSWNSKDYVNYSKSVGRRLTATGDIVSGSTAQETFKNRSLSDKLNPLNVIRECCDSSEHPCTIPVILALDVTGSMGSASVRVAEKLNTIMTSLYNDVADVQFMIMGIGDLASDKAPIQVSQFESDIRIAEQLDEVYFEGNGGSNGYESYTAAWYFGLYHTALDCWRRGKKGIIITMGDEPLNPYLPKERLSNVTGDNVQCDINTKDIFSQVQEKFDVYHLTISDRSTAYVRRGKFYAESVDKSYRAYLNENHYKVATLDTLANEIVNIVKSYNISNKSNTSEEISW